MKKWAYMIPIYAYLVRARKWAISDEDKTEGAEGRARGLPRRRSRISR